MDVQEREGPEVTFAAISFRRGSRRAVSERGLRWQAHETEGKVRRLYGMLELP